MPPHFRERTLLQTSGYGRQRRNGRLGVTFQYRGAYHLAPLTFSFPAIFSANGRFHSQLFGVVSGCHL